MLFLLSANGLNFIKPSEDLWFAATRDSNYRIVQVSLSGNSTFYLQDDIVSVLGCTSRQQWCNPTVNGEDQCQPLRGNSYSFYGEFPARNDKQRDIYEWLSLTAQNMMQSTADLVATLGVSALTARFKVTDSIQGPIPDNQWQSEVLHWFSASMATLQDAFVANAAGAPYPDLGPYFSPPENPQQHGICTNQVCFHT